MNQMVNIILPQLQLQGNYDFHRFQQRRDWLILSFFETQSWSFKCFQVLATFSPSVYFQQFRIWFNTGFIVS